MMRYRLLIALAAVTSAFILVAADYADARAGRGFSGGSRGNRTFMAPPATKTAPTQAQPIQRSTTQPAAPVAGAPAGAAAGAAAAAPRAGMFGGGLMGGLAAGFIGAGLFGLLFGSGLFGGMAGFASFIGLMLQLLLIVIVARLAFNWWQRRNAPAAAPAYAGPAGSGPATGPAPASSPAQFTGLGTLFGGNKPAGAPLAVVEADYEEFEKLLGEVQTAYSAEDEASLRAYVTPEMATYFSEELAANAERGVVNRITDVKLLQGDLAEAWREDGAEYATVAMRFALTDRMVDRNTGATVEGGEPGEVTELWTFQRSAGRDWKLSAIQQA
ncbi:MAG: TIM44-like domain-containing protein [Bradyrhizobium sp.]|nr:TIM44-like domain-containing protein [Bradyrhizobium sp.]